MKNFISFILGICLMPSICFAFGNDLTLTKQFHTHEASFMVAAAKKLGIADDSIFGVEKIGSQAQKGNCLLGEKETGPGTCVTCSDVEICPTCPQETPFYNNSPKICMSCIHDTQCASGNVCSGSLTDKKCRPCSSGEICRCPNGQTSDGSGGCMPLNCTEGQKILNGRCTNCTYGEKCCRGDRIADGIGGCTCPSGYESKPGYICVKQCVPTSCPAGQYFDAGSCACYSCPSGEKCNCPGIGYSDGRGGCTSNPFTCAPGQRQNMASFTCVNCTTGDTNCNCPSGQVANGSGGCKSNCPTGYSTSITCTEGYTTETSGTSGGLSCTKCIPKACGNGGYVRAKEIGTTRPTCSTLSEWQVITTGKSGEATCYACVCKGSTFGAGGCCSGGKVTCGGTEGPCRECCNNNTASCGAGRKCSGYKCTNCAAGESCFCPSGQVSNGSGGCKAATLCYGKVCPQGTVCNGVAKQCCAPGANASPGSCTTPTLIRPGSDCEPAQFINGRWVEGKCR